ncbi:hypothetical protein ACFOWM_00645 [Ferruginibacter yonginensis]|uniref:Uncharacterized protein n=1 Tax=Ferruginibacter yonginensis TaxID=1310416 RepID=A0ABV8QNZ1_9BACT
MSITNNAANGTFPHNSTKKPKGGYEFKKKFPDRIAFPQEATFKFKGYDLNGGLGVWYDPQDIINYMKDFPALVEKIESNAANKLPKNCSWKVGFNYVIMPDAMGVEKIGFYVVPTIVNDITMEVYNYFDLKNVPYYHAAGYSPIPERANSEDGNDTFVSDDGNMFP